MGRGALAGPLIVVAVEISSLINGIADSKLLTTRQRELRSQEIAQQAKQISFGVVTNMEIDQLGMSQALELAYQRALDSIMADFVLTDNYDLANYPHLKTVKGDQLIYQIAVASIVAKVARDKLMRVYDELFPHYGWKKNVGYGTSQHRQAIISHGHSPLHRLTFCSGLVN